MIGEVTDDRPAGHPVARRGRRRRAAAHRRARRARSTTGRTRGPTGSTRCRPTPADALPRPATGDELRDTAAAAGRLAEPGRQVLGHRPVRPVRAWATPRWRCPTTPAWSGSTRSPGSASRSRLDCNGRFARARPVRGRAARARRGLPQRRHRRRRAARRHRLPELRLARGPGRDVAVRAGGRRPRRRLPRARHPGHRRQREPLQPDRRRPRSTRPRWSASSACMDDVTRRTPSGWRHAGPEPLPAGHHPRRVAGSAWAHVVHDHLGGLPPALDLAAERRSPRSWSRRAATAWSTPPTTSPTAASPRRWSSRACDSASARGSGSTSCASATASPRSPRCSPSPPAGCWSPCRARRRCASPTCAPRAAWSTPGSGWSTTRRRPTGDQVARRPGPVHRSRLDELRRAWTAPLRERFGA